MKSLLAQRPEQLRRAFAERGLEPWRAVQVLRWVYRRRERDPARMTDLAAPLREQLGGEWSMRALAVLDVIASRDGSHKLVLGTADGARIESVLMPEGRRRTVCVSTQIGCALDCGFCATGRLGLARNLEADEIVDQVLCAAELLPAHEAPTHVVFMGMGEPLLNLANVVQAIRILCDPEALGLAPRHVTVSTAGVASRIVELGRQVPVRLAVSLHATTDLVRDGLVPLNRRFPIASLLEACRAYPLPPRERISFEYTLMRGVNDSQDDARRLVALVRGLPALVNLIPMNEHPAAPYRRPPEEVIEQFAAVLARARVPVTVRRSRGEDILAACGQLGARPDSPATSQAGAKPLPTAADNACDPTEAPAESLHALRHR